GSFSLNTTVSVSSTPQSVMLADFNADNRLDLLVANSGSNTISLVLGNGNGTFGTATNFSTGSSPMFAVPGDFNGDGKQDVAVAKQLCNNIRHVADRINARYIRHAPWQTDDSRHIHIYSYSYRYK